MATAPTAARRAGPSRIHHGSRPHARTRLEHPPETVLALDDVETVVLLIDGRIGDRISDSTTPWSAARPGRRYTPTPETLCDDLLEQVGPDKSDDIAPLVLRLTSRKPRPPA